MELILEKLIPIVGSKGWKTPNIENAKYVRDITTVSYTHLRAHET